MNTSIADLLNDKLIKSKQKTESLSRLLRENKITTSELIHFAENAKATQIATCIEAIEYASKQNPGIVNQQVFLLIADKLSAKEPRIKWESAKVIGNTVHLFQKEIEKIIPQLLDNTEHSGTVVRWSAAYALSEILKLKSTYNKELIPTIEAIMQTEEKNSIKKIYIDALKKIR